ncbi:vitamin K epoxide reductase family protein [Hahella sp. NBU794]|uniref:vitamin K epoxide reductase family protein n=1 Tax=Hahella sp. NBU794 TaxID=3422590 RepID=UPI003D6DB0BB
MQEQIIRSSTPFSRSIVHRDQYRALHSRNLWAHFMNMALALWLICSPALRDYSEPGMIYSDVIAGFALLVFAGLSLSWRLSWARWVCAVLGLWLMSAPLLFWTPNAAAYLNDTLVGILVIGFAIALPPSPGISSRAELDETNIPPGWDSNPSSWFQRLPIIALAMVGLLISTYLCAYQLEHIPEVWDPFFAGSRTDPQNGAEEIITSYVSEAWPVPDAGVGALTYALEILSGLVGSHKRWRTMPWLVALFGFMIVPLGIVSITFIIIQPILLETWCALCLIAATAMLLQIPYSLDELVATGQFLYRRKLAGRSLWKVFFLGDEDNGGRVAPEPSFEQRPAAIIKDIVGGGVGLPWNLAVSILIGVGLMCTRLLFGTEGAMADWDHLIGSLTITVAVIALTEVARPVRFLLVPLGICLLLTPFAYGPGLNASLASLIAGLALILLSLPRGDISRRYGNWNRWMF